MDIQEIARLHSRYNEAPLIIDMPADGSGTPLLQAPNQSTSAPSKPFWTRLSEAQRLVLALLIVAGIAFPVGMLAASGGKYNREPAGARPDEAMKSTLPASNPPVERDQAWPAKTPTAEAEPIPQAPVQTERQSHRTDANSTAASAVIAGPASSPSSAIAPASISRPAAKAPSVAARQTAAAAPAAAAPLAPSTAKTMPQTGDPRRSNEIKLF